MAISPDLDLGADNWGVGEVIYISDRLADKSRPSRGPAAFFFALDCPISYLAAEQVERALGEIEWVPVLGHSASLGSPCALPEQRRRVDELFAIAGRQAETLRLPLIEPDYFPSDSRGISRAAVYAAAQGAGRSFALAAARLAFCGGFDLADPDVIAEAAAAAGLSTHVTVEAACDPSHDATLEATSRGLTARGVVSAPAIRVGDRWFEGYDAVPGASTFSAVRTLYGSPHAPQQ